MRLDEEEKRVDTYCHVSSREKIITRTESMYIANHSKKLELEFCKKVSEEDGNICNMIYRLLSRIPNGIVNILKIFESHVVNCGKLELSKIKIEPKQISTICQFLEILMAMHTKFLNFCKETFNDDPLFDAAVGKVYISN